MKSSLTVYKASAGSGKTFTLAIQYIKTLIEQESRHAYSHILAVTFTNKATAEMKDRILQQLYGIWKGLPSSANYLESLQKELRADSIELPEEEIRSRAGAALCHILHDYNRFRVETIDSFFQSVLKNLAHELSLTANLKVDLNDKEVLHAAVDRIMERLHLTPTVLNWILEYVNDRISNNERWDIAREVKSFAAWIFKEAYLAREHEMREVLRENKRIGELRTALNYELHASLDIVQSAAANFRAEMEAWGLGFDQFSRGNTIDTYLRRIEDGNMKAEFGSTLQGYTEDAEKMLRKADRSVADLVEAAAHFSKLLAELRGFQTEQLVRHTSASLALKHLNPLRLLGVIDEEVTALNHENNRFLLAKTPILLHELIEENDAPFIFEKMGAFFHHVMIDEFQDTSTMQWKNFGEHVLRLRQPDRGRRETKHLPLAERRLDHPEKHRERNGRAPPRHKEPCHQLPERTPHHRVQQRLVHGCRRRTGPAHAGRSHPNGGGLRRRGPTMPSGQRKRRIRANPLL